MSGLWNVAVTLVVITFAACGGGAGPPRDELDAGSSPGEDARGAPGQDAESAGPAICGNHKIEAGEACDDGNTVDGDGCDRNCTLPACGNGRIDPGEPCDDGNAVDGDGCDRSCTRTACGNGIVTAGEACDDGNLLDGDGCDSNCTVTACGNGVVTPNEACDDGNLLDGDGCDRNCTVTACGNGVATLYEACDDGNPIEGDGCDSNCTVSACGNGIASADEACDDGNPFAGDGCDPNCTLTACGNGAVSDGEACDDGNAIDDDGCRNDCTSDTLAQLHYVKASNTGQGDQFGESMAVSADGSTIAVGASAEDSAATGVGGDQDGGGATNSGAVYIYVRSGLRLTQQAYLKAPFGSKVALSADGSTLAVSAPFEDSAATGIGGNPVDDAAEDAGAVYVYARQGTTWALQTYLKASNTDAFDNFGFGLSLSADGATLAVGAYQEASAATGIGGDQSDNSRYGAGAVYVYTRTGTLWSQQAYLKAIGTRNFGVSVALSSDGSTLAVGGYGESSGATGIDGDPTDQSAPASGAAYVFTRTGATWHQQAYVKASNTDAGDFFGYSVALSRDGATLAVGAPWEASAATGIDGPQGDNSIGSAGAVYVYTRSGVTWAQAAYVKASHAGFQDFGWSVALSGNGSALLVGAPDESTDARGIDGAATAETSPNAGAAYLFSRTGTTWAQQHYIKASHPDEFDQFGHGIAISSDGSTSVVGAFWESGSSTGIGGIPDNNSYASGAVYVFQ
jgi:cysteine-rich repeat protein